MTRRPPCRVAVLSVAPSPYQRDLFRALQAREDIDGHVYYQEAQPPDSPWPRDSLESHETILPGIAPGWPTLRSHLNWGLPRRDATDLWIVNTALTSWTGQRLMRQLSQRGVPWVFWGERLRVQPSSVRRRLQTMLLGPLREAAGIAAVGRWAQDDYRRRFPKVTVENFPYAPGIEAFRKAGQAAAPPPDRGCRFLFCGQLIPRKGIDLLLRAFERVVRLAGEKGQGVTLRLVGRCPDESKLWRGLPSGGWRQHVEVAGFVAPDELPPHFARADVFVLPSRHDGWGVVVHQAAAAGLPVIASDAVGATRDLVESGVTGRIVPVGEVEPLTEAMVALAFDPEERRRMGEASRQRGLALTPENETRRWSDWIRELTGGRR